MLKAQIEKQKLNDLPIWEKAVNLPISQPVGDNTVITKAADQKFVTHEEYFKAYGLQSLVVDEWKRHIKTQKDLDALGQILEHKQGLGLF